MPKCQNCFQSFSDDYGYCPNCGQKAHLHRISFHDIAHDAVHYFTHADKGIFFLLKKLITETGAVARKYIEGQRKQYFTPLNFFLICVAIFVIVNNVVKPLPSLPQEETTQTVSVEEMRAAQVQDFFKQHGKMVSIFALPFIAFLYYLFYIKGRYNFAEHVVANMYMTGFTLLVYAIAWLIFAGLFPKLAGFISAALLVFQAVYNSVFYYRFMNNLTTAGAVKATAVSFLCIFSWVLFSFAVIMFYVARGFPGT